MRRKTFLLILLLLGMLVLQACGQGGENSSGDNSSGDNGEYPYGHYEDDKMIGKVWAVHDTENVIELDISEWKKRDLKGPGMEDIGYVFNATYSEETSFTYEDGTEASIEEVKSGHKLLINPPARGDDFEGHADEVVLLEMTYKEKYGRLLSHIDGYNIVVMYEPGNPPPPEMQDSLFEEVGKIVEGTEHDVVASWIEYDPNFVVNYKEELDIEQFPVIFVYNQEELLLKAYEVEKVYDFLRDLKE
ncbi:hypothetical protein [Planococcus salinarum]|uniref:hypothetical protein n=1 Tax=Planococcus salinarum TaxID=622695 RepID=UPI000E3B8416|nr:hypothetical protein [Planococcus salinarum]TAA71711.1 hypothetical protein D2909_10315 [Planococcus salinarum]